MEYQFVRELNENSLLFNTTDSGDRIFDKVDFEVMPREGTRLEFQKDLKKIIESGKHLVSEGVLKYHALEKYQGGLYLVRDATVDAITQFEPTDLREACQVLLMVLKVMNVMHHHELVLGGVSFGELKRNSANEVLLQDPFVMNYLGKFLGPGYRIDPPVEVIRGKEWEEKSDLFSWGVLAFRIISGKDPFEAATPEERMNKIMRSGVANLKDLAPKISDDLNNLILSSLNQQPKNRPALEELISALSAMITAGSYEVSEDEANKHEEKAKQSLNRYESKERFWLWFRKYGFMTVGISGIILVLSLVFMFSRAKPVITVQTKPMEVINYYFQSLKTLDVGLIEEAAHTSKNTFKDMITNLYVINRARQASSQTFTDFVTVEISDFKVGNLGGDNVQTRFKVDYALKFVLPGEIIYFQRQDIFCLKQAHRIWRITDIKVLHAKTQTVKKPADNKDGGLSPSPQPVHTNIK